MALNLLIKSNLVVLMFVPRLADPWRRVPEPVAVSGMGRSYTLLLGLVGSRQDSKKKQQKKNPKDFAFPSSALKIHRLASLRLLSGLWERCKYNPLTPHRHPPLHFVFFPHPSLQTSPPIVLKTSFASAVDWMTQPSFPLAVSTLPGVWIREENKIGKKKNTIQI